MIYGGGGFIGSHLAKNLLDKRYEVKIFEKLNFSLKNIQDFINDSTPLEIIEGDFNNEVDIKKSLKNVDYVFHLVSSTLPATSNLNPLYDVETNLISTLKFLQACIESKVKKIIFMSSGGTVYGIPKEIPIKETHPNHPICSYGIIKKTIEDYLFMYRKIYGLDYFVFRLSNPYGEKQNPSALQGVIPVFLNKIHKGEPIEIWGDGEVIRDYIYVKDATDLLVSSLEIATDEKVFNVGSGKGTSLNDLLDIMKKITGRDVNVKYLEGRAFDIPVNILDISLAQSRFGWTPSTDLEKGLRITYEYITNNY